MECFLEKKADIDFSKMLIESAEITLEAAKLFNVALTGDKPPATFAQQLKDLERKGDENTHKIIIALNTVFITPIDREDIMRLAAKIDDVLDGIEASIARFDYMKVNFSDSHMRQFSEIIVKSCDHMVQAMFLLANKKYMDMRDHTIQINQLENDADELMRQGIREIFNDPKDPYHDFKLKELYERMEETTDQCEDVADILETVILRYS